MNLLDYILPLPSGPRHPDRGGESGHYVAARLCGREGAAFRWASAGRCSSARPVPIRPSGCWRPPARRLRQDARRARGAGGGPRTSPRLQPAERVAAHRRGGGWPAGHFVLAIALTGAFTPAVSKSCARGWPRPRPRLRRPMRVCRGRAGPLDQWRSRRDLAGVSLEAAQSGPRQAGATVETG